VISTKEPTATEISEDLKRKIEAKKGDIAAKKANYDRVLACNLERDHSAQKHIDVLNTADMSDPQTNSITTELLQRYERERRQRSDQAEMAQAAGVYAEYELHMLEKLEEFSLPTLFKLEAIQREKEALENSKRNSHSPKLMPSTKHTGLGQQEVVDVVNKSTVRPVADWREEFGLQDLPDMTNTPWPTHSASTETNKPVELPKKTTEQTELQGEKKTNKRILMYN